MLFSVIPIGLIAVFIGYVFYLLLIKKDMEKLKSVLLPGIFFVAVWAAIYFWLLK